MNFVKMHGLGNDFIIFEDVKKGKDYNKLAKDVCDRHTSIGADGIMLALDSDIADIRMRIINSDGSEAEMCGNGIRCFAKYVYEKGLVKKSKMKIETLAGIMEPELIIQNGKVISVKVNMGKPSFKKEAIPMLGDEGKDALNENLNIDNNQIGISSLLMGVPHTMVFVENVDNVDITQLGPKIEKHNMFPRKTNVNFVEIRNKNEIKVRTWERGAGVTLACGTGSCACVVAANKLGLTETKVNVHLAIGVLKIEYIDDIVFMTGPAEVSFYGNIE